MAETSAPWFVVPVGGLAETTAADASARIVPKTMVATRCFTMASGLVFSDPENES
jgi:hypothetical protein